MHLSLTPLQKNGTTLLTFGSSAVSGPFYGDGYGLGLFSSTWLLNALLVNCGNEDSTSPVQPPTRLAAEYLIGSRSLAASSARDWAVVGPFIDPHFEARTRTFGPDSALPAAPSYNASYRDPKTGTELRWTRVKVPPRADNAGPAPLVLLPSEDSNLGSVSFASTYVRAPASVTEAVVVGSMSTLGTVYVNGKAAVEDRVVNGLQLMEFNATVPLKSGEWNSILVRTMHLSWSIGDWSVSLSFQSNGTPLQVSACLPGDESNICH